MFKCGYYMYAIAHEFDDLEKACKQILEDAGIHRR